MSRPNENRVRVVAHVLPETERRWRALAAKAGTLGKVADSWAGAVGKRPATKRRAKSNDKVSGQSGREKASELE